MRKARGALLGLALLALSLAVAASKAQDGGIQSSPDHPVLFEFKLGGDAASPFEGREGEACDKFSAALSTGIRELLGGIAVSGPIPVECAAGQDEGSLEIYLRAAAVVPAEVQAKLESLARSWLGDVLVTAMREAGAGQAMCQRMMLRAAFWKPVCDEDCWDPYLSYYFSCSPAASESRPGEQWAVHEPKLCQLCPKSIADYLDQLAPPADEEASEEDGLEPVVQPGVQDTDGGLLLELVSPDIGTGFCEVWDSIGPWALDNLLGSDASQADYLFKCLSERTEEPLLSKAPHPSPPPPPVTASPEPVLAKRRARGLHLIPSHRNPPPAATKAASAELSDTLSEEGRSTETSGAAGSDGAPQPMRRYAQGFRMSLDLLRSLKSRITQEEDPFNTLTTYPALKSLVVEGMPRPILCGTAFVMQFVAPAPNEHESMAVQVTCGPSFSVDFAPVDENNESAGTVMLVGMPELCACSEPPVLVRVAMQGGGWGVVPAKQDLLWGGPIIGLMQQVLSPKHAFSDAYDLRFLYYGLGKETAYSLASSSDPLFPPDLVRSSLTLDFPLTPADGLTFFTAVAQNTTYQAMLASALPFPSACGSFLTLSLHEGSEEDPIGGAMIALACDESSPDLPSGATVIQAPSMCNCIGPAVARKVTAMLRISTGTGSDNNTDGSGAQPAQGWGFCSEKLVPVVEAWAQAVIPSFSTSFPVVACLPLPESQRGFLIALTFNSTLELELMLSSISDPVGSAQSTMLSYEIQKALGGVSKGASIMFNSTLPGTKAVLLACNPADDLPDNILPVVTLDLCPGRYRKPGERLPKPGQEGGVELEVEDEIIVQVHEHVSKHKHRKHRRML